MKIIIFLGLLGATLSALVIPRHLMSASNSNELLLNLNNGQLLPLRLQGPLNAWIPPFTGFPLRPQQAPAPGRPQTSLPALDRPVGLFPDHIAFPGLVGIAQGAQTGQLDPSQPQTPSQTQQGANPMMPYVFPFKTPQEQAQIHQYYPAYMLLPWEQSQQTATQSPQQTGQQQFEEEIPFYAQYGYIPQPVEIGVPGGQQQSALETLLGTVPETVVMGVPEGQQQLALDTFLGAAPETVVMPAGGVIPHLGNEGLNLGHDKALVSTQAASPNPSTANFFTTALDPNTASVLLEEKAKTDSLREP